MGIFSSFKGFQINKYKNNYYQIISQISPFSPIYYFHVTFLLYHVPLFFFFLYSHHLKVSKVIKKISYENPPMMLLYFPLSYDHEKNYISPPFPYNISIPPHSDFSVTK